MDLNWIVKENPSMCSNIELDISSLAEEVRNIHFNRSNAKDIFRLVENILDALRRKREECFK